MGISFPRHFVGISFLLNGIGMKFRHNDVGILFPCFGVETAMHENRKSLNFLSLLWEFCSLKSHGNLTDLTSYFYKYPEGGEGTQEKLLLFSVWRYLSISGREQVIIWGQFSPATIFFCSCSRKYACHKGGF